MTAEVQKSESVLVVDVGTVNTRALLFDVVDGYYRFLGIGEAQTTTGAPVYDIGVGVRQAVQILESITGRSFGLAPNTQPLPEEFQKPGAFTFAATISAGNPIKLVMVGLEDDLSMESLRRLASAIVVGEVQVIHLNDRKKPEERIDAFFRLRPDLVLIAGGTEGGASQPILKLLESVGMACFLIPESERPEILFAGNSSLHTEVQFISGTPDRVHFAPNIRPDLDVELLEAAQAQLANLVTQHQVLNMGGMKTLNDLTQGNVLPTHAAFGRIIRFLSKTRSSSKGVLGINVGASAVNLLVAYKGMLTSGVFSELGLNRGLDGLFKNITAEEILTWSNISLPVHWIREYFSNKALFPTSLPFTTEELAIEQAAARVVMQHSTQLFGSGYPQGLKAPSEGLLPACEPIIASGSVLTRAPSLGQSLMMILDGLQPTGVTTLILDHHQVMPALGVVAARNPSLAVQVLDSSAFIHLGTVISPVGNLKPGTPMMKVKMVYENGQETSLDIHQGTLEVIPLLNGQTARLHIQPFNRVDIGMGGPGRSGSLRVMGGTFGVIFDARGRPINLPTDPTYRNELFRKWLWMFGG